MTRRRLGPVAAIALVVGNIIGAGVFMLPAALAPYGWNAVLGWLATLAGALCLAWVFAELAAQRPRAGGVHGAVADAFGADFAYFTSWGYFAGTWTAIAAITVAGVSYLQRLIPEIGAQPFAPQAVAVLLIVAFAWANTRELAGAIQIAATAIKILPFVMVIGLGGWLLWTRGADVLLPVDAVPIGPSMIFAAVGLATYALIGLESAAVPADAIDNPRRNVARATLIGTAIAGLLTLLSSSAVSLLLPPSTLAVSIAPIADFIGGFLGSGAGVFVTVCAVVSCLGTLNGTLVLAAELPATMARSGVLPEWFGRVNELGAPVNAAWLGAAVSSGFVLLTAARGGVAAFEILALVTTVTSLFLYVAAALAAGRFSRDGRLQTRPSLWLAISGALGFGAIALGGCGTEAMIWGIGLLAVGWPLRYWAESESRRRKPA